MSPDGSALDFALRYASLGFSVFPCRPGAKTPLTESGFHDACHDPEQVRKWWGKSPAANIGIPTGPVGWVLDVDPRNGGNESLEALLARFGPLPDTLVSRTPSGGAHYWFAPDSRAKNTAGKLGPGLDTRGTGGYVLVEGSRTESGAWVFLDWDVLRDDFPGLPPAPEWLLHAAFGKRGNGDAREHHGEAIVEGGRNAALTSLAGVMRRRGMSLVAIEAALLAENASRCNPPLPPIEVMRIARSVSRYEPERIDTIDTEPPVFEAIPLDAYSADFDQVAREFRKREQDRKETDEETKVIPVSEFIASARPADWIVEGLIQRGNLYACTAPTNMGKTAVMLVLILCIAAGRRFAGVELQRSKVVVLCGENQDGFRVRLRATMSSLGIDEEDLGGWLYVFPAARALASILVPVIDQIAAIGEIGTILIDTSVAYFGGDAEDDNVQALEHARMMRMLCEASGRPAVIANCHPPKHTADREGCIPRGGSSFINEIDTNLSVWVEGDTCSLHWTRKKRGPDFDAIAFEFVPVVLEDCGIQVPTVYAKWIDERRERDLRKELNKRETLLLQIVGAYQGESLAGMARRAGMLNDKGEPLKSQVQRTLSRLMTFGLVGKNRHGYFLTSKGKDDAYSGK